MTRLAMTLCGILLASSSLVAGYQYSSLRIPTDPASAETAPPLLASTETPVTVEFLVTQCSPEQAPETTTIAELNDLLPAEPDADTDTAAPEGDIGIPAKQSIAKPSLSPRASGDLTLWASPLMGQGASVVEISPSVWLLE